MMMGRSPLTGDQNEFSANLYLYRYGENIVHTGAFLWRNRSAGMLPQLQTMKKLLREIGIVLVVALVLFSAAVVLFFAEGGQIAGINEERTNPGNPLYQDIGGYVFEPVEETITPLYDDEEIVQTELWQMPLRDALLLIGIAPFTYIPPSISKIISVLYLVSGIALLILFTKRSETNRDPDSRREQIYRWICQHPGKTQQQIADDLGISRGSLKYHLGKLMKNREIHQRTSGTYPQYFPSTACRSPEEETLLTFINRSKDCLILSTLLEHPGITRTRLAADLTLSPSTLSWRMKRLENHNLILSENSGRERTYKLTPKAEEICRKLLAPVDNDPHTPDA